MAAVIAITLVVGSLRSPISHFGQRARQSAASGNCKQIVTALRIYATEHGGKYPDAIAPLPTSSNQAFRTLIREEVFQDERVFGCQLSRFVPNGKIGGAPDYSQALEPGENHWAMTKGVTDQSPASMPLVFENPKVPSWPPVWDTKLQGKPGKGRVWKGGKIIVGFNDTSVQAVKIEPPTSGESKKDVFTDAAASMEILDIKE
jgi:hypothetical protein